MITTEIKEFAKMLIQRVRDCAVQSRNGQLYTDNLRSPIAKRWNEMKKTGDFDKFGEQVIVDTVDDTIFYLLLAIDEGSLTLSYHASDGKEVNLTTEGEGELAGWRQDWTKEFTNERFQDMFPD